MEIQNYLMNLVCIINIGKNINFLKRFICSHVDEVDQRVLIETLLKLGFSTVNQLPAYIFKGQKKCIKGYSPNMGFNFKSILACHLI